MMIKAYGDTLNDGSVQLSFTLPVPSGPKADEAAKIYTGMLGFSQCEVVHSNPLSDDATFFIVYGKSTASLDFSKVEIVEVATSMDFYQVNNYIKEKLKRKIVIVGACTGSDAHTVGIDAIMNMKGYDQHYGLERYPEIEAYNLGAQVDNEDLIHFAKKVKADAILISQIVTQKEVHIHNMTNFIELMEAEDLRDKMVICAGGPRISNKLAIEIGFDAGFGRGSYPEDVASFVVEKIAEKEKGV
ncbi:MAG: cobalamin-dependent protein [Spirochaetaceae bacterium]|jgi:beta-lysine 5,6-aminomutase beta subunit|nr:cobalamin-dependent protein [Spirochaetaceae bacterium]